MIWFKAYPRCKQGDMSLNEDEARLCLQCGYVQYAPAQPAIAAELFGLARVGASEDELAASDRLWIETALAV